MSDDTDPDMQKAFHMHPSGGRGPREASSEALGGGVGQSLGVATGAEADAEAEDDVI